MAKRYEARDAEFRGARCNYFGTEIRGNEHGALVYAQGYLPVSPTHTKIVCRRRDDELRRVGSQ